MGHPSEHWMTMCWSHPKNTIRSTCRSAVSSNSATTCRKISSASSPVNLFTLWLCQNSYWYWKWWFIVDFPIEHGDFPYKSSFSHGFPIVLTTTSTGRPMVGTVDVGSPRLQLAEVCLKARKLPEVHPSHRESLGEKPQKFVQKLALALLFAIDIYRYL